MDLNLNIRGNPEALGEVVPRRFPAALSGGKTIPFNQGSGRLQLADTVAHHPLAARVAVNRIWLALFGQGLVRTPSNFGRVGDRPALPELLEYLAARLGRAEVFRQGDDPGDRAFGSLSAVFGGPSQRMRRSTRTIATSGARTGAGSRRSPCSTAMLAVSGELDRAVGGESKPLTADFRRAHAVCEDQPFPAG